MLPRRALYDTELREYAKTLRIPYFRVFFMRNAMPKKPNTNKSAIINLDSSSGGGTRWTAYRKRGKIVIYYDSFGNLRPPKELIEYLGNGVKIQYNHDREQTYNTSICGHLGVIFYQINNVVELYYCLLIKMSWMLTFNGNASVLTTDYFPSIELERNASYGIGLVDFQTYNSIPNVDDYGEDKIIVIPEGAY